MTERIFTIGHSTHPIDEFVRLLTAHGVEQIVDVRTIAKTRHNPQFGEGELWQSLPASGIGYGRLETLGGLRHTVKDSPNGAWKKRVVSWIRGLHADAGVHGGARSTHRVWGAHDRGDHVCGGWALALPSIIDR